jgi:hypothetical protein
LQGIFLFEAKLKNVLTFHIKLKNLKNALLMKNEGGQIKKGNVYFLLE